MVSFQCEACGDTFTKKKLDNHRNQCRDAAFTCLDCMKTFHGTEYRSHTSCISEDQKYQGALYREKPSKKPAKGSKELSAPRNAYVEDAPDPDTGNTISIVEAPPEAPDPPSAAPSKPNVNVFDFLVTDETPNASKVSLHQSDTKALDYAPSILGSEISRKPRMTDDDPQYEANGFSYGTDAVVSTQRKERPKVEYITPAGKPAGKDIHAELMAMDEDRTPHTKSKDKKRKRLHVEELDLTAARRPSQEPDDTIMPDAPAPVLHSGLTGGLNRLLSQSKFPPSPDYSNDPPSPVRRSKATSRSLVGKDRNKPSTAVVKVRKPRTSDESRPRKKKHRTHIHHEELHDRHHHREYSKQRTIAYPSQTSNDESQQLVVFKSRAELLLSFVTKGEESKRGMSMHKALKRYHRERGRSADREDEEKELWKGLRLRRNDRGEIVISLD